MIARRGPGAQWAATEPAMNPHVTAARRDAEIHEEIQGTRPGLKG